MQFYFRLEPAICQQALEFIHYYTPIRLISDAANQFMHGIVGDQNLGKLRSLQICFNLFGVHPANYKQGIRVLFMFIFQQLIAGTAYNSFMLICQCDCSCSTAGYLFIQNAIGKFKRFPEFSYELVSFG